VCACAAATRSSAMAYGGSVDHCLRRLRRATTRQPERTRARPWAGRRPTPVPDAERPYLRGPIELQVHSLTTRGHGVPAPSRCCSRRHERVHEPSAQVHGDDKSRLYNLIQFTPSTRLTSTRATPARELLQAGARRSARPMTRLQHPARAQPTRRRDAKHPAGSRVQRPCSIEACHASAAA